VLDVMVGAIFFFFFFLIGSSFGQRSKPCEGMGSTSFSRFRFSDEDFFTIGIPRKIFYK
jgi:hypothetical protein